MNKKLGDRIRKYRQIRDIKQSYISKMLGISVSAYGKIERGETQLTIDRLHEIGEFLGFTVTEILESDLQVKGERAYQETYAFPLPRTEQQDLKKILETLPSLLEGQNHLMRKVLQVVERKL